MLPQQTHLAVDHRLCGVPLVLAAGVASVALVTTAEMAADDRGLVHGGFVFGLADFAAMLAVNDPNVVLGSAEVKLRKPVEVGDRLVAAAHVEETAGRRSQVSVVVRRGEEVVFSGDFRCFTLDRHVLDRSEAT
jgi:acyl-coenzyme A thioesterase PaaI-like protein